MHGQAPIFGAAIAANYTRITGHRKIRRTLKRNELATSFFHHALLQRLFDISIFVLLEYTVQRANARSSNSLVLSTAFNGKVLQDDYIMYSGSDVTFNYAGLASNLHSLSYTKVVYCPSCGAAMRMQKA